MITDKDIEKLKAVFATKEDLISSESRMGDRMKVFEDKIENRIQSFEKKMEKIENKMQNLEINLLSEMQNLRDTVLLSTRGYGDRLEEHHQRLTKVEEVCRISTD